MAIEADLAEETASEFKRGRYGFRDIDVIGLEGIFLLKRELRSRYDLAAWIDCTFETALARAVARAQEGLPPEATIEAYRTIYFPAQRLHLERDESIAAADLVFPNDSSGSSSAMPGAVQSAMSSHPRVTRALDELTGRRS